MLYPQNGDRIVAIDTVTSLSPYLYFAELCVPVAHVTGSRQLRSTSRGLLNFPRYNM